MALDGRVVAFVEVKSRSEGPQDPLEALDRRKRREVQRTARRWIAAHPGVGREFRFDAVGVHFPPAGPPRVVHLRDAFFGEDC